MIYIIEVLRNIFMIGLLSCGVVIIASVLWGLIKGLITDIRGAIKK